MRLNKTLLSLFFFIQVLSLKAQNSSSTNSPYSRYGPGEILFHGFSEQVAMGGNGLSLSSSSTINLLNPATYSGLTKTVFEAGAVINFYKYSSSDLSSRKNSSNLSYLALGFPVMPRWGMALALTPFTSVGYKIESTESADSIGTINTVYSGSGGINRLYWGNAFKINDNFSIGLNISYFFGTLDRMRSLEFPSLSLPMNLRVTNSTSVSGFYLEYGLQYRKELKNKSILQLGLITALKNSVKAESSELIERYRISGGGTVPRDTLPDTKAEQGFLSFPLYLGFGGSLKTNRWLVGVDVYSQSWSDYKEFSNKLDFMTNATGLNSGVELAPNPDAVRNYFNVIRYRAGVSYSSGYLSLNGNKVSETKASIGLGLPLQKVQTVINLTLEAGVRGTTENDLIKEEFYRLNIGFSFTDKWFVRRKID